MGFPIKHGLNMHRNPDLAILLNDLGGGGAERVIVDMANHWASMGLKVDLVISNRNGALQGDVSAKVNVVSFGKRRIEACLPDYLAYLQTAKPGKVLVTIESSTLIACLGKLFSRHKHSLYIRMANTLERPFGQRRWLKYFLWRQLAGHLYRCADKIICISAGLQAETELLVGKKVRCITIYNPVLTDDYAAKLKQKHHHIAPKPYVLAVGRLDAQKGYSYLLRAFQTFRKSNPKHNLLILGEGTERNSIQLLAKKLNISEALFMPGFVENPFPYMAHADMFVMSSIHEGAGNVITQALAAGTPKLVCTDCPHGPRELLGNGRFGRLVPPCQSTRLAEAMLAKPLVYNKKDLEKHLAQFKLKYASNRYLEELGIKLSK